MSKDIVAATGTALGGIAFIIAAFAVLNFFVMLWLGGLGHVFHVSNLYLSYSDSAVVTVGLGLLGAGVKK